MGQYPSSVCYSFKSQQTLILS